MNMKVSESIRGTAVIAVVVAALMALWIGAARAEEPQADSGGRVGAAVQADDSALESLRKENARLAREVAILRKENQALRRQLVLLKNRMLGADGTEGDGKTGEEIGEASEGLKHSISTNRIRHNSNCRYYDPAPEKACTKEDGRPCKACGG